MAIVYALFETRDAAELVVAELTRNCAQHGTFEVHVHDTAPLNADHLPEAATESARNTVLATLAGAALGGVAGGLGGMWIAFPGLGPGVIFGFGVLTGGFVGVLSAVMSGHRAAKPELIEVARELTGKSVLVLVVTHTIRERDWVEAYCDEHGAEQLGRC